MISLSLSPITILPFALCFICSLLVFFHLLQGSPSSAAAQQTSSHAHRSGSSASGSQRRDQWASSSASERQQGRRDFGRTRQRERFSEHPASSDSPLDARQRKENELLRKQRELYDAQRRSRQKTNAGELHSLFCCQNPNQVQICLFWSRCGPLSSFIFINIIALQNHNLWSDRFLSMTFNGEGPRSKFKLEGVQTGGQKRPMPSIRTHRRILLASPDVH